MDGGGGRLEMDGDGSGLDLGLDGQRKRGYWMQLVKSRNITQRFWKIGTGWNWCIWTRWGLGANTNGYFLSWKRFWIVT